VRRGHRRTEAVVLDSLDFGESDRIISFYTLTYGKIKGIAKGARCSRKRFVGNLDPPSHISLLYFVGEKSDLVRVEEASLVDAFAGLKPDIEGTARACYLLELVSETTREGMPSAEVFRLLLGSLKMLAAGTIGEALDRFFEIRLLSLLGLMPRMDGCVICNGALDGATGGYGFSADRGGIVCAACSAGVAGLQPVSPSTARILSAAARLDGDKLQRLKVNPGFVEESERLLAAFIRLQIGRELRTKRFMEKLKAASFGVGRHGPGHCKAEQ
jgi:DNA repair protein RecO (recombination protein O)